MKESKNKEKNKIISHVIPKMLRQRQKQRIIEILNCPQNKTQERKTTWKILIYDQKGMSILSTLFDDFFLDQSSQKDNSISERAAEFGITYHARIDDTNNRTRIEDVPAIYFFLPTQSNLDILINDIKNNLYDTFYINFIAPIKKQDLRNLAQQLATVTDGRPIASISDSYLDFISFEPGLFELFEPTEDSQLLPIMKANHQSELSRIGDLISDKLLSVISTSHQGVPLILTKGNFAKIVGDILNEKIRQLLPKINTSSNSPDIEKENLKELKKCIFGLSIGLQRPILLLLDRSIDFLVTVHHGLTYDSLLNDIFGIKRDLNGILINHQHFDNNRTWDENCHMPIGVVLKKLPELLSTTQNLHNTTNENLLTSITNIDDIKKTRECLVSHINICNNIIQFVEQRKLNEFNFAEIDLMTKSSMVLNRSEYPERLIFNNSLNKEDKLRLFTVAYLSNSLSDDEIHDSYESEFGDSLNFLYKLSMFKTYKNNSNVRSSGLLSGIKTLFGIDDRDSNLDETMIEDSKEVLTNLPIAVHIKNAIQGKNDGFVVIDPLQDFPDVPIIDQLDIEKQKNQVMVMMLGGGSYTELDALNWVQKINGGETIEVTYGCTKMQRPEEFLHELMNL